MQNHINALIGLEYNSQNAIYKVDHDKCMVLFVLHVRVETYVLQTATIMFCRALASHPAVLTSHADS